MSDSKQYYLNGGGPKPWLGPLWIATRRRDTQSLARNQLGPSSSNIIRSKSAVDVMQNAYSITPVLQGLIEHVPGRPTRPCEAAGSLFKTCLDI